MKTKPSQTRAESITWEEESFVHRRVSGRSVVEPAHRRGGRKLLVMFLVFLLSTLSAWAEVAEEQAATNSSGQATSPPSSVESPVRPGKRGTRKQRDARGAKKRTSDKPAQGRRRHRVELRYSTQ